MALDAVRNEAYGQALQQVVGPDSVVLDLGAGTGVHGLMAARLGARRVYLVEQEDMIAIADENVRANGLQDIVRSLHGRIEDVELPERVDVIVSVLTGNFLLTEDLLPSLFQARDRYLKPGGTLLPSAAVMEVTPVSAPLLHDKEVACWSAPQYGVDLGPARLYAANTVFFPRRDLEGTRDLAVPTALSTIDFHRSDYAPLKADATVTITESGLCHGWVGWFSMKLADRWLSTSPRASRTHWSPAFLPLDPPVQIECGEQVQFHLARAPYGDWVWGMKAPGGAQRHSTLFSAPMKATTLQKAALDYQPGLTAEGQSVAHVLAQCGGTMTMTEIAQSLQARYPARYRTPAEALRFVQVVVKRHA